MNNDSLTEFQESIEQGYIACLKAPELQERGIHKLLQRILNTLEDIKTEKDND